MLFCLFQSGISLLTALEDAGASLILRSRACSRLMWSAHVGCIKPYSAYEDEGHFCTSSARAARCSLPSAVDHGSLIHLGLGTLVVFLVGPELVAYLGLWLDNQRRLRLIACSVLP